MMKRRSGSAAHEGERRDLDRLPLDELVTFS